MKNIIFLVFVSLLARITGDSINATKNKIPSGLGRNLNEVKSKNITTLTKDENPNDNELGKVDYEKSEDELKKSKENNKISLEVHRKTRDSALGTSNLGIECVSCHGSGLTASDENCYKGSPAKTQKCAEVEQCFTELHPQYIKRGCTLPSSINRTFVCKCPLCNDKPSEDLTYYEYRTISDWEYDNKRLEESVVGLDLLCKVCSTRGINAVADTNCKLGKNADYMQCGHEELCFTNIDHQINFVSRGCISKPVYNSLYFFCNESKCNNDIYTNPRKKRSEFYFTTIPMVRVSALARREALGLNIVFTTVLYGNMHSVI